MQYCNFWNIQWAKEPWGMVLAANPEISLQICCWPLFHWCWNGHQMSLFISFPFVVLCVCSTPATNMYAITVTLTCFDQSFHLFSKNGYGVDVNGLLFQFLQGWAVAGFFLWEYDSFKHTLKISLDQQVLCIWVGTIIQMQPYRHRFTFTFTRA